MSRQRPAVTIVVAGRNDDYGGDFRARLFRTASHNVSLLTRVGLTWEYLLVEWNPLTDRPLLSDEFVRTVPGARAIVVPPAVHEVYSLHASMPFHEMPAKNAGIRRASAPWIIVTNADVLFGPEVLQRLADGALDARCLYRARRIDVRPDRTWEAMQDPANQLPSGEGRTVPVDYLGAGGDFCLASRALWHELRGFDERIRFSTRAKDWQFFLSARERGIAIEFIGTVFHLDHAGGFRNTAPDVRRSSQAHFGGPWDIEFGLPTTNLDDWGLASLDSRQDGSVETLSGVPAFADDDDGHLANELREWLTGEEPDWMTAGWLHAIFGAWREHRALAVRTISARAAARLQGFLGLAQRSNVAIRGEWRWPEVKGFTIRPLDLLPAHAGDWIVDECGDRLCVPGARADPSWWPSRRPPVDPVFNPLLARRLLRAWIELERRGSRRVLLYGAGSHTRELLSFGWPDSQHLVGIVTSDGKETRVDDLPVMPLARVDPSDADAIVISSASYELEMLASARAVGFRHVVSLYDSWPR